MKLKNVKRLWNQSYNEKSLEVFLLLVYNFLIVDLPSYAYGSLLSYWLNTVFYSSER